MSIEVHRKPAHDVPARSATRLQHWRGLGTRRVIERDGIASEARTAARSAGLAAQLARTQSASPVRKFAARPRTARLPVCDMAATAAAPGTNMPGRPDFVPAIHLA